MEGCDRGNNGYLKIAPNPLDSKRFLSIFASHLAKGWGQKALAGQTNKAGRATAERAVLEWAPLQGHTVVSLPETLLDRGPPIYMADAAGRVRYANAAYRALSPYLDENLAEVARRVDAEHPELILRHKVERGGAVQHWRAHHFLVRDGVGGTYTDITREAEALDASWESESRFRDVIRSTSDWVWEADANLNLTYLSERITEALEVLPQMLIGKNLLLLGTFEAGGNGEGSPMRERLLRDFQPFRGEAFLVSDARGATRRFELSGVPVFEPTNGRFVGYRGTGTDVTQRHRAEHALRAFQRKLQDSLAELQKRNAQLDTALSDAKAADRAKTEFLGKMSHELRTPLNAVIGFSELAGQQVFGPLNTHYLGYFRDIRNAAHHLLNIINDILDAVSIEGHKVQVDAKTIPLAEVVAEARSLVAVRAEQSGIDLSQVAADSSWIVVADQGRLRQILVNLLNNAVKFTPPGGTVGVAVDALAAAKVAVTVWDTGIGIPADQHERIFESFHQVGPGLLTAPREGTGLGLSVSRQLARLMGGDLTVESTVGKGSRFTFVLPRG
jgi:PAS domain S-box-containing protein